MFDVYAETFRWQILNVAYRSFNQIVLSQVFIYCLSLSWRFNDYKVLSHNNFGLWFLVFGLCQLAPMAKDPRPKTYSFLTKHRPGNALISSRISSDNSAAVKSDIP